MRRKLSLLGRGRTPRLQRVPRPGAGPTAPSDLGKELDFGIGARWVKPAPRAEDCDAQLHDEDEDGDETPDVLEMMEGNER